MCQRCVMGGRRRRDQGQATVLLLAVVALVVVAMVATAHFGARLVDRAQAQVADDAAALAGVSGGRSAATQLASANDGVLLSFAAVGDDVQVVVRVGDASAAARATRAP